MSFDPTKWGLRSLEVFSALVPGGIALYALRWAGVSSGVLDASWPSQALDWVVFIVGSLVLGYLAHPPAHVLNIVYDSTYRRWRRRGGDPLLDYARRAAARSIGPKDSVYAWAKSEVAAASERDELRINQIEGISKMFRTLTFLAIVSAIISVILQAWPIAGALGMAAVMSFLVFSERRFAATKEVYQCLRRVESEGEQRIILPQ